MSISKDDLFRRIKADFLQAVRAGGSPNRAELLGKYPELAAQLNELFAEVDRTPPHNQPETATLPPDNAGVDEYATLPPEARDQEFSTIVPADESIALPMTAGSRTGTKVRYFGDYELLSEIARGGMGVVYKAQQVNLNRIVALKMILAGQLASDEDVNASIRKRKRRRIWIIRGSCRSLKSASTTASTIFRWDLSTASEVGCEGDLMAAMKAQSAQPCFATPQSPPALAKSKARMFVGIRGGQRATVSKYALESVFSRHTRLKAHQRYGCGNGGCTLNLLTNENESEYSQRETTASHRCCQYIWERCHKQHAF